MELKSKYSYGGEVSQMSMNCSELEDKSSQYAQHNTQSSSLTHRQTDTA